MKIIMDFDFDCNVSSVFNYLADVNALPKLTGASSERVRDGDNDVNGVGAIRTIKAAAGLVELDETIRTLEQDKLIEYQVTRSSLIKEHWGRMEFSQVGSGSHLHYEIDLKTPSRITDQIVKWSVKPGIVKALNKLGKELK